MKTINEQHLQLANKFVEKVVKELQKPLDIRSYRVEETPWNENHEELRVILDSNTEVQITFKEKVKP